MLAYKKAVLYFFNYNWITGLVRISACPVTRKHGSKQFFICPKENPLFTTESEQTSIYRKTICSDSTANTGFSQEKMVWQVEWAPNEALEVQDIPLVLNHDMSRFPMQAPAPSFILDLLTPIKQRVQKSCNWKDLCPLLNFLLLYSRVLMKPYLRRHFYQYKVCL